MNHPLWVFRCPSCGAEMVRTNQACDGHTHPKFVCLCGATIVLDNIQQGE